MTHLSAAAVAIDVLGRNAGASTNPERDMAIGAQAHSGGLAAWFGHSTLGKMLAARKATRDLNRAIVRLSSLSPHLLADIGILDNTALAGGLPDLEQQDAVVTGTHRVTAPVALRPARRPAIGTPQRAPAPSAAKLPARAARKEQPAAQ